MRCESEVNFPTIFCHLHADEGSLWTYLKVLNMAKDEVVREGEEEEVRSDSWDDDTSVKS